MDQKTPSSRSVTTGTLLCSLLIILGALLIGGGFLAAESSDPICVKSQLLFALGQIILPLTLSRHLHGDKEYLRALGLKESLGMGLGVGLVIVAPAVLSFFVLGARDPSIPFWPTVVCTSLIPSIAQELCFRGMLFGFLFRFASWSFFPAALLGGAVYSLTLDVDGLASSDVGASVFWAVLQTLWLSWLYMKWKWNLWVGVVIQVVFRLTWALASDGEDQFGGFFKNLHLLAMMIWSFAFVALKDRSRWWPKRG